MVDDRWRREPTVVVLGRANVGKSTLVNRIVGRREAVVEARPGVTRDRKELTADWAGRSFRLIDTGGWVRGGDELDAKVAAQSEAAMAAADVALVVVDATTGVTDEDVRVARATQRLDVDTLVVVNKVDGDSREALVWEFLELGLGEPVGVSALHGRGTGDLLDAVVARFGSDGPARDGDAGDAPGAGALDDGGDGIGSGGPVVDDHGVEVACSVAVVGRPNVGKSTLFNRLIGEDRAVVHDQPGTTRDSVDTVAETSLGAVRFVDTAGMRRRSRIGAGAEYYSMVRALDSVDRADVALLVIDATDGVTHQDQRLAERIDAAGCPVMVLLNKWDLLDAEGRDDVLAQMARRLAFIGDAVVLRVSALTGKGVGRLLPALEDAIGAYRTRIPTRQVNDAIGAAQAAQPAPGGARVLYATQGATDPPTFTLFSNRELPATYLRYLEHHLQDTFSLGATPIKLRVRRRSD